ncbi:related to Heat shock factor protein [Ustilago trichophora]|uniref:Related to Heat shock factor protein n=1 Tax=Ustilago trichophora TaxID=86804 RepID=A0A5C3E1H8_9BASI|nr:related to Heat shock factor protein [Ustilago trichophora]
MSNSTSPASTPIPLTDLPPTSTSTSTFTSTSASTSTPTTPTTTSTKAPVRAQQLPSTASASTSTTASNTPSSTPAPAPATVSDPTTEDVEMAVSAVSHPAPDLVAADVIGDAAAPLKAISPVASATLPNNAADPRLSLPLLGTMTPEEAQRFGLNHLHNIGPGASYSSPPQAFRPPSNSPQPFQAKISPPTPSPVVKPTDVTSAPSATASVASTSAASDATSVPATTTPKMAPVVAGMGTLPPNVSTAVAASSSNASASGSGSGFSASDSLRAIPTNKNNPAFLNKLRSMVDDPNTDELIRWSPDGASFFVPNHVRFGDEVLPRFFKHNRFSSFVRQLNMYGFHKVPHLQQGALKHDSPQESELWEFSNPHFHRDHPDWLSKVQRKKGPRDDKETHGEREASATTGQELMHAGALMRTDFGNKGVGVDANGDGALQLASVLNAINAIKNAQTSISADLRHLQNSNQNLWQEAVESRQRAKRQQETINKILRFLAGVFGNQEDAETPVQGKKVSGKGRGGGRRVGVRPQQQRNKSRLMIEDGSSSSAVRGLEGLELPTDEEEIEEMPSHLRFQEASSGDSPKGQSPSNNGGSRFTQIGSPPNSTSANDFSRQLSEAVSTPGGSRRLSSQASNQVLNALASGEGNAWLASLFGASLANQGSKSTGPASGGGLKLDPQMVAALQQALASAGSGAGGANSTDNGADYFGGGTGNADVDDFSSRFSAFPSSTGSSSNASAQQSTHNNQGLGLDADALARIAGISQALVQSPARQNFNAGAANNNNSSSSSSSNSFNISSPTKGSASLFDSALADDGSNNQQLALSLSRATRDLHDTSNNVDQVTNSINSLIEGLQTNPNLLQSIGGQPSQPLSSAGSWPNAAATEPFGAGINTLDNATQQQYPGGPSGATPPTTAAAAAGGGGASGGMDDFDVDSFLSQFVDSSQAPGGGVTSPLSNHASAATGATAMTPYGESPSFAFSPATTAAFLHGAAGVGANDAPGIYAQEVGGSGSASGTSSSTASPPENNASWNTAGKKRKPSTSGVSASGTDVEMPSARPVKKSASKKN